MAATPPTSPVIDTLCNCRWVMSGRMSADRYQDSAWLQASLWYWDAETTADVGDIGPRCRQPALQIPRMSARHRLQRPNVRERQLHGRHDRLSTEHHPHQQSQQQRRQLGIPWWRHQRIPRWRQQRAVPRQCRYRRVLWRHWQHRYVIAGCRRTPVMTSPLTGVTSRTSGGPRISEVGEGRRWNRLTTSVVQQCY